MCFVFGFMAIQSYKKQTAPCQICGKTTEFFVFVLGYALRINLAIFETLTELITDPDDLPRHI